MDIYLEDSVIEMLHLPCIQLLSISQSPLFEETELHTTRKLLFAYLIINNLPSKKEIQLHLERLRSNKQLAL